MHRLLEPGQMRNEDIIITEFNTKRMGAQCKNLIKLLKISIIKYSWIPMITNAEFLRMVS